MQYFKGEISSDIQSFKMIRINTFDGLLTMPRIFGIKLLIDFM